MRITMAQLNPVIGDFYGNCKKIEEMMKDQSSGADLILFTELFPSGYPAKDWLLNKDFMEDYQNANSEILKMSSRFPETAILYGTVVPAEKESGNDLYNAARIVKNGHILFTQYKSLLPSYDIFDETRYFQTAAAVSVFPFLDEKLGITICEDAWNDPDQLSEHIYHFNPVKAAADQGATVLINIAASPFSLGKPLKRYNLISHHSRKYGIPFIMLNQTGSNDELIFDGSSMVTDKDGGLRLQMPAFEECVFTLDTKNMPEKRVFKTADQTESAYRALISGIKDYADKNGFKQAVLGLSGGVDSALTCVLAAEALGPENILAVYMPSPYSSAASGEDAEKLASNLGVRFTVIPISDQYEVFKKSMAGLFENLPENETEENMQARIRGNMIMALSNKFEYLPLASGNKSELAAGYCTLYGDMCGGLSVIGDCYKTMVYAMCGLINKNKEIIPDRILMRPPSAELKPGQTDQDTLPPYDILDDILEKYLEKKMTTNEIIASGNDREIVEWVLNALRKSEHKRLQAPPVLKITDRAFGSGRRIPVAANWRSAAYEDHTA